MKASFAVLFFTLVIFGCRNSTSDSKTKKNAISETAGVNKLLTVKAMQGDLAVLWGAIKEVHPGYGFYTSPAQMQLAYDKVYASIKSPLSETRFMDLVYPFLCQLRCGHTQLKHSANYKQSADEKMPHLPFHVLVRKHLAWITLHQAAAVNTGDEIVEMNGVRVSEIIDHGYNLYNGDGYNETFKELFLSEYDGFEDACNKYYHWQPPYQLKLRTAKGEIKIVKLKPAENGAAAKTIVQKTVNNFAGWAVAEEIENSRLRLQKNTSTAWFQATPFAYTDTTVYQKAFALIKKEGIKNLILDMRHNSGGDIRIATQLLAYLANGDFNIIRDVQSRLSNPTSNHFAKYFDADITKGFKVGFKVGAKTDNWYHIDVTAEFGQLYGPFKPVKTNHFDGNLIVLIDGATFSSGALFTAALKAQKKDVKFIGRETAGTEEGCNGMTIQKLTLPNSGVVVDFPWMRVVSLIKNASHGRGIMPDYNIEYRAEDVVINKDLDLKKAMSLIRN